jgi:hypothetical protein
MNALWTTCLLMAFAAQPVETSPTPTTRLYVRTIPPGARVVLDGQELGTTDGLFLVPPGTGKLSITLDGQQPEIRQVEISEGRITRIEVNLKPGPMPAAATAPSASNTPPAVGAGGVDLPPGPRWAGIAGGGIGGEVPAVIELTPGRTDRPATPEEPPSAIEKALSAPAKFTFLETPLEEVAAFLGEQHNINVVLDKKALEEAGLGTDIPVTLDLSGIPLRSALNIVLRDFGLTWTVRDKMLEITASEALDSQLVTRLYDVSHLTGNAEGLADLIMAVLNPQSWGIVGGAGSVVADRAKGKVSLVVSQSEPVHRSLVEFLTVLRMVVRQPADKPRVALSHEGFWRQTPETDAVRKALEKDLTCTFMETPLEEAAKFLQKETRVPVVLDRRSLAGLGVGSDTPLTFAFKDIALQDVLAMGLKDVGLTYKVADDVLLVTAPESESSHLTWAIYPVGDLVTAGRTVDGLVQMLTTTVAPDSWDAVGGPGAVRGIRGIAHALVITQSCHVHRQIAALLAQLRRP